MLIKYPHNPAHLLVNGTAYFISSAIYQKRPLLQFNEIKNFLLQTIRNSFDEKNWKLEHWVILDNHYHLLAISDNGTELPKIIKKIHGSSAQFIRGKY